MNTYAGKIIFEKCHIQQKQPCVYLVFCCNMGLWGHCDPQIKEYFSMPLCVRISVTSQAQLATTASSYFCCT